MQAETNLDNYASVIYDAWSLEIQRKDIRGNQKNLGHSLETDFSQWEWQAGSKSKAFFGYQV